MHMLKSGYSWVEVQDAIATEQDFKEVAHLPVTRVSGVKVSIPSTSAGSHIRLACAQKTSTDRLEGALREGEALRVEVNALRQNLDKAEGDKTRVRARPPAYPAANLPCLFAQAQQSVSCVAHVWCPC